MAITKIFTCFEMRLNYFCYLLLFCNSHLLPWSAGHRSGLVMYQEYLNAHLRIVKRSLPPDILRTLACALVMPPLVYYCNSLMAGLPLFDIQHLQSVQNAAAYLFDGVSRRGTVVPVLRDDLHWLQIRQRIDFKIGVLSFKAVNGLAPPYLVQMFTPVAANPALRQTDQQIEATSSSKLKNTSYVFCSVAMAVWLPFLEQFTGRLSL